MLEILNRKWMYDFCQTLLLDIIMGRRNLHAAARDLHTTPKTLLKIYHQIFPKAKAYNRQGIAICKNIDSVYLDHNSFTGCLGSTKHGGNLVGLVDTQITPELAKIHQSLDRQAIETNQSIDIKVDVYMKDIGQIPSVVNISPMQNAHGECNGVLIVGAPCVELSSMPFGLVLKHLNKGHASIFLAEETYEINLEQYGPVVVTQRDMEILLYLLAGFSAKETGTRTNISARTVETILSRLKDKLQFRTRKELITLLLPLL